jgi:hypothetical protein
LNSVLVHLRRQFEDCKCFPAGAKHFQEHFGWTCVPLTDFKAVPGSNTHPGGPDQPASEVTAQTPTENNRAGSGTSKAARSLVAGQTDGVGDACKRAKGDTAAGESAASSCVASRPPFAAQPEAVAAATTRQLTLRLLPNKLHRGARLEAAVADLELGEGGFAAVHLGSMPDGKFVAIKCFKRPSDAVSELLARIRTLLRS